MAPVSLPGSGLSPEDRVLANLERSLLLMEQDYARTLAAEGRLAEAEAEEPEADAGGGGEYRPMPVGDGEGIESESDPGAPEGYQALGGGALGDSSEGEDEAEGGQGPGDAAAAQPGGASAAAGEGKATRAGAEAAAALRHDPAPLLDSDVEQIKGIMGGIDIAPPDWAKDLDSKTLQEQVDLLLKSQGLPVSKSTGPS